MSHFTVGVIVKKEGVGVDFVQVDKQVQELIAQYDENLEVPGYERVCSCVENDIFHKTYAILDAEFGTINELWEQFNEQNKDLITKKAKLYKAVYGNTGKDEAVSDKEVDTVMEAEYFELQKQVEKLWREEVIGPRDKRENELKHSGTITAVPDGDCEDCHGTGKYLSTYNPDSKWDWWDYGGRWNGALTGDRVDDGEGGLNFADEFRQLSNNCVVMSEMDKDFIPFAIITPDGEWHEKGNMGWWGMVSDEKEDWKEISKAILDKYRTGEYAVALLDMHI